MSRITDSFTPAARPKRDMTSPAELMRDLLEVGQTKVLGYLPQSTLRDICGVEPAALQQQLEARGLKTLLLRQDECQVGSGALYAFDEKAMAAFLTRPQNAATLAEYGWPQQPEAFVLKTATEVARVETKRPLYDLIALAYNDPRYRDYKAPPKGPVAFRFG